MSEEKNWQEEYERLQRTVAFMEKGYLAEHENWGKCKWKEEAARLRLALEQIPCACKEVNVFQCCVKVISYNSFASCPECKTALFPIDKERQVHCHRCQAIAGNSSALEAHDAEVRKSIAREVLLEVISHERRERRSGPRGQNEMVVSVEAIRAIEAALDEGFMTDFHDEYRAQIAEKDKRIAELEAALKALVELTEAWINGPLFEGITFVNGSPPALHAAKRLLDEGKK